MKNGMTKTIATASANGKYCKAVNIAAMPNDMKNRAKRREPKDAAAHAPDAARAPDKREQDQCLYRKSDQNHLRQRHGSAKDLGHGIAKRGDRAKSEHERNSDERFVLGHQGRLRWRLTDSNR